jgi:NAD(P)-dependent dehydrogenase (short-subunit alcohol dehydrogenase family)
MLKSSSEMNFQDKVVLITGATSGIGKVVAMTFASHGADIVLTGRRDELGMQVVRSIRDHGGKAIFVRGDVSREEDVKKAIQTAVQQFGRIDIAFNNAGTEGNLGPLHEQTAEDIGRVIDVNIKGVLYAMKHEIREMLKSEGGCIINNASVAGHIGYANAVTYTASKHAVIGATRAAALEVIKRNIRINAISPAGIETEMLNRFVPEETQRQQYAASHPIGRTGKPEEVAAAVLWLASRESAFVVGHSLIVDGGYTAQ